ncbi:MAG: transposase, partial [Nitrospirae bacterium]|nr:transposase [Nitrospirota bacterium]
HVCVVWLPKYSPKLNAIEGLWGYLKRSALNNYFFGSVNRLGEAIVEVFHHLNRHPHTALSLAYRISHDLRQVA